MECRVYDRGPRNNAFTWNVNDISEGARKVLRRCAGHANSDKVHWIVDDLTKPDKLNSIEPAEQNNYFSLLNRLVKPGGYALIAAFSLTGSTKCSGLPVFRYDSNMLKEKLGSSFELVKAFNYSYTTPSGNPRDYVYTLFQRSL